LADQEARERDQE